MIESLMIYVLHHVCFAVMSFPAEGVESAFRNHIDDAKNYLDYKYKNSYAVYNLSQRTYRPIKFGNRVSIINITIGNNNKTVKLHN